MKMASLGRAQFSSRFSPTNAAEKNIPEVTVLGVFRESRAEVFLLPFKINYWLTSGELENADCAVRQ